jgi:transcription antitermination factor NusG
LTFEPSSRIDPSDWPWFALHVKARSERTTAELLRSKGYEEFVPLYYCRRRWSDRIKRVMQPLFPGYVFCRLDLQNRLPVLVTPGVLQIVGLGRIPAPIDEEEIISLQKVVISGFQTEPSPFMKVGERVRIVRGALEGVEGILTALKGSHRLIVSVTLLRRSVAVEIDEDWIAVPTRQGARDLAADGIQHELDVSKRPRGITPSLNRPTPHWFRR